MPDSVYKVIEVIGTSPTSWEEAAKSAVEKVAATSRTCGWQRSSSST